MNTLPKRTTVFLDSSHGTKHKNQVTHVLTESIDTADDEAVVVRIIHAQIPAPYPIWIEEGHNTLVAGISMYGAHYDLYGSESLRAPTHPFTGNQVQTRQFVLGPHNLDSHTHTDIADTFMQCILHVPVGGYTPESLAVWMSGALTEAFTWKFHGALDAGEESKWDKLYHLNFPYNGITPMPMLGGSRSYGYGHFTVDGHTTYPPVTVLDARDILSRAGAGDTLGTVVNVTYNRTTEKFESECMPRQSVRWSYSKYWDGESVSEYMGDTSNNEKTNYMTDIFNYRRMAMFGSAGYVQTSSKLMSILGITTDTPSGYRTPGALSGLHCVYERTASEFVATSGSVLGRWNDTYTMSAGASAVTAAYPPNTRNIHVKTNLATNSVVDSFLRSKSSTLAVIPAHTEGIAFHYAGAADSVFSSMITTSSINLIHLELTDEHANPLNLGGTEFTIGLEFQYVRINILQNEIKDVRDRRAFLKSKLFKENPNKKPKKKKKRGTIKNGNQTVRQQSNPLRERRRTIGEEGIGVRESNG